MIVKEIYKEATGPYYDNAGPWEMKITLDSGEKESISFNEGEPEDMSFSRDLSDVFSIISLIELAYKAGVNGEKFIHQIKEDDRN